MSDSRVKRRDYDLICIGLGPAGMAVSIMGSAMGLKVCAIEKHRIGGECMNVGCIPSKSLLEMAKTRHTFTKLETMGLEAVPPPKVKDPFPRIQNYLHYINEAKTVRMFDKVHLVLGEGKARFVDSRTVGVGEKKYRAKRIYICTGTRPFIPPVPGLAETKPLTNENLFNLESLPESMIVLGSGAIACEMAQAFARLGTRVTMVMRGKGLLWREDREASQLLTEAFEKEGIAVLTNRDMIRAEKRNGRFVLETKEDGELEAEQILAATGRRYDFESMNLEKAGVRHDPKQGILVNDYLQTSQKNIYACGDCNGYRQLTHAAMHQGMLALMNSMLMGPMRRKYKNYVVPWTIFTQPAISAVGMTEPELKERNIRYETIVSRYEDYGAAIAEAYGKGFVKAFASPSGRIYGACIVGEGSGEMIQEWGLAIQKKIRMHDIMFLQHSFPTMSFLSKRVSENWMMKRMQSKRLQKMAQFFFRL